MQNIYRETGTLKQILPILSHHNFCAASIALHAAFGAYLAAAASKARYAAVVVGKIALFFADKFHVPSKSDGKFVLSISVKAISLRIFAFVRSSEEVGVCGSASTIILS